MTDYAQADLTQRLSNAWNDLRNAVVGRSAIKPAAVPQSLYDSVANYYERWRKALAALTLTDALLPMATYTQWVATYRRLAAQASAAGLVFKQLEPSGLETAVTRMRTLRERGAKLLTPQQEERWKTYAMVAGLAVGLPLLLAIFYRPD